MGIHLGKNNKLISGRKTFNNPSISKEKHQIGCFFSAHEMAKKPKRHFPSTFQIHFEAVDPASQTVFLYQTKKQHLIFWEIV